jgi:serine protease Do
MKLLKAIIFGIVLINCKVATANFSPNIPSFANIVEPLVPTVVNIYTIKYMEQLSARTISFSKIPPLDKFNNFLEQYNSPYKQLNELNNSISVFSLGSGFIVDNDGYIATNEHIVSGSDEVFVKLFDGTKIPATIIETDPKSDLALLKIEKQDSLTSVNFSDSDEFRVGDIVIAIGSLHETGEIVTTGIISSKNKETSTVNDDSLSAFIKTNISIGASSSGGPLFNLEGKIIGINTNLPQTDSEPNFGFAIPSNKLQEIVKKMRENGKVSKGEDGKVSKGKLGICVQQLTQELIEALSLNNVNGIVVVDVHSEGVGAKAGIKRGDVITEFNGKTVISPGALQLLMADCRVGEQIKIKVIRNNEPAELVIRISEATEQNEEPKALEITKNDIAFSNISPQIRFNFGLDDNEKGIVITEINSRESNLDLQEGDLITAVDQQYINDITQFDNIYKTLKNNNKRSVVLLVKRQGVTMFVAFPVK